jgi:hypothetical protein
MGCSQVLWLEDWRSMGRFTVENQEEMIILMGLANGKMWINS